MFPNISKYYEDIIQCPLAPDRSILAISDMEGRLLQQIVNQTNEGRIISIKGNYGT
jgi:hypothetical protein